MLCLHTHIDNIFTNESVQYRNHSATCNPNSKSQTPLFIMQCFKTFKRCGKSMTTAPVCSKLTPQISLDLHSADQGSTCSLHISSRFFQFRSLKIWRTFLFRIQIFHLLYFCFFLPENKNAVYLCFTAAIVNQIKQKRSYNIKGDLSVFSQGLRPINCCSKDSSK